MMKVKTMNMR